MFLVLDLVLVVALLSSMLIIGQVIESKFRVPTGFGALLVLFSYEIILSFLALNPLGGRNSWTIESELLWLGSTFTAIYFLRKREVREAVKKFYSLPIGVGVFLMLISQGVDRSWDGSGYHDLISLLLRQNGSYWNWQNLMWAQWFPAGQETLAASFLPFFHGTSGFVVPGILWVGAFAHLARSTAVKYMTGKNAFFISAIFVISVPVFVAESGTSYVDIQTALSIIACVYFVTNFNVAKSFTWILILVSAGLTSTKWSGFALIVFIAIYGLTIPNRRKIEKFKISMCLLIGSFIGIFPIALRNLVQFGSPTFPFKGPFNLWGGLFSESVMTKQIGIANEPFHIENSKPGSTFFHEYILSPFQFIARICSDLVSGGFHALRNDTELTNYTSYDARLGGIGISLTLLIVLILFAKRKKPKQFFGYVILLSPMVLLPMNWWPRYIIGLPLAVLFIEIENLAKSSLKYRASTRVTIILSLVISLIYGGAYIGYKDNLNRAWPGPLGLGGSIARLIGPGCKNIVVVGGGLTFSSGLWGDKLCNIVVDSIHFGNPQETLGQFGSLEVGPKSDLQLNVMHDIGVYKNNLILILTGLNSGPQKWSENLIKSLQKFKLVDQEVSGAEANGNAVKILVIKNRSA